MEEREAMSFDGAPVYQFRELVSDVLSPGAIGTLEQLTPRILEIYGLAELLDREPIRLGEAILRLETLADEIRSRPLLHDMLVGRAN